MASDKGKGIWIILVLVAIAVIFVVLAFRKEAPQVSGTASQQDVLADKAATASAIKPAHSPDDQTAVKSMKPAEAVVMPPHQMAPRDSFAIQVYSFKDKVRADSAVETLKAKGYSNAYIMVSDLGARGIWYRVRVGTFANEGDAQKVLETINTDLKSGIIVSE